MRKQLGLNYIRPVVAAVMALSITNASLAAHRQSGRGDMAPVADAVQVLEAAHVVGGQAGGASICVALVAISPFFPPAILPAVFVCSRVLTETLG